MYLNICICISQFHNILLKEIYIIHLDLAHFDLSWLDHEIVLKLCIEIWTKDILRSTVIIVN